MSMKDGKSKETGLEPEYSDGPRMLADIGATNARFALEHVSGRFESVRVLKCADYAGIEEAVRAYLATLELPSPRHAAIAIANPIDGDFVRMTNRDWAFSIGNPAQARTRHPAGGE